MLSQRRQKEIARLRQRKYRELEAAFLVEGFRAVQSAVDARAEILDLVIEEGRVSDPEVASIIERVGGAAVVDERTMGRLTDVMTSQGVLAVVRMPDVHAAILGKCRRILALDGVQDPGNAGTLIRTAAWFGIDGVLAGEGTVDLFNPKVVRAAMGGTFDVSLAVTNGLAGFLQDARAGSVRVYAADMDGTPAGEWRPQMPSILVVGNEGSGLSLEVAACIDERVTIPRGSGLAMGVESLNVAQAASILGYLWTRSGGTER